MGNRAPIFVGMDEVGRGCWAGPLLIVATRSTNLPKGLRDSKKLSKKAREDFYKELIECCEYGDGWVEPSEIDKVGLARALHLAADRALIRLKYQPHEPIILDGTVNYLSPHTLLVRHFAKADDIEPIVSAASIIAKVLRDNYMTELAARYRAYGFDSHVGYGTKSHIAALTTHGAIKGVHRFSYKPVQTYAVL